MVGSMVTSSKSAYTTPRSAAPRVPAPVAGHCWPLPPQETLKHSSDSVPVSLLVCTRFCLSALCISDGYEGLILNAIFPLLPSFWVFPFALGRGVSVFGGIQHSPVDGCSAAICNFGVLTRENDHKSFYSTILRFWWGNEDNGDLLQKVPCTHYCTSTVSTPDPGAGHPIPHTNKHICKFTCICTVKNKEIFSLHTDYHIASNAICFSVAETISNWPPFLKTEQWFLLGILLLPRYI